MASIKSRIKAFLSGAKGKIKAALFSNVAQSIAWGLALFANTGLVAIGLVNKDVPGAVAAMLGAIAAALMIFSILLRERADAEDEDEADAEGESGDESETATDESETESEAASEESADIEESEDAESETESESAVGSAKSGEAIAAGEEA